MTRIIYKISIENRRDKSMKDKQEFVQNYLDRILSFSIPYNGDKLTHRPQNSSAHDRRVYAAIESLLRKRGVIGQPMLYKNLFYRNGIEFPSLHQYNQNAHKMNLSCYSVSEKKLRKFEKTIHGKFVYLRKTMMKSLTDF